LSTACENRCSAPEHGLLQPAMHDATPALISASTISLTCRPFFEKRSEFFIKNFALFDANSAEYLPLYSPVLSLPRCQSRTAVIFAIRSPQPLESSLLGAFFIMSTSTKLQVEQ